jgi:outer membrane cobalamin receptor
MSGPVLALMLLLAQFAPSNSGEVRLAVTDEAGLPIAGVVELVSDANHVRETFTTDSSGVLIAKRLPFGLYRVAVTRDGFASFAGVVEVRSELPIEFHVTLRLAPLQAQVTVRPADTLIDPGQTTAVHRIGADLLQQRMTALPGRSLPDLVNTQPGWLMEANGVLHPRGSEYQTQYVIDGLPLTDNRSPAFAPEIDADEVHSMSILTGGYPAEYGRKLGGVIEVVTSGSARQGVHASVAASVGSFSTKTGNASVEYGWPRTTLSVSAGLADSDRYLDPPVEQNFTNHGTTAQAAIRLEHDLTDADRLGIIVRHGQVRFAVPNEQVQQEAGQRQDRDTRETVGQFSYQRVLSSRWLAEMRGLTRNLSAGLSSNAAATPVLAEQDRGIREWYLKGTMTAHLARQEWKAGGDISIGTVRERFGYQLTDAGMFDPDTPLAFDFADQRRDREQALFVQDRIRLGSWTVNAGVRWDHYHLLADESAISPRLGVAWAPSADLVVRASYDRVFQTPAVENLLLASSPAVEALNDHVARLPVQPSLGSFYEAGVTKALNGVVRVDASYFVRRTSDFADDDVLLNTGVSFPIAFREARINGTEVKIDVPRFRSFSGSVSYGYLRGTGYLPVTGGLLLGDKVGASLGASNQFPVTQDQRHTVRGRASYQLTSSAWLALAAAYGSGLPFEFEGDRQQAVAQYGERIVDRVNFDTGRVRPSFSVDASVGITLSKSAKRSLRLQADVRNVTNRFDVINFAGLFSGTALAPPRSGAIRLRAGF